jgi:hypothetical protein
MGNSAFVPGSRTIILPLGEDPLKNAVGKNTYFYIYLIYLLNNRERRPLA